MGVLSRDQEKMRRDVAETLQNGDQASLLKLLASGGRGELLDPTAVDRLALACLMEAAFSMAREPQPILMSKGAEQVHSERETELEREIESQAQRYELQLAKCRDQTADRDRLALQVDQLQARLKLLGDAADEAVSEMSYAVRNTLRAIYNASEGEIRF